MPSLKSAFWKTYPADYNFTTSETLVTANPAFYSQNFVMFALFLNLPASRRLQSRFTLLDLLKNMLDLRLANTLNGKTSKLDIALAVPMFLYHVVRMLVLLPLSMVKGVTELLPLHFYETLSEKLKAAVAANPNPNNNNLGLWLSVAILWILHTLGRAITSPIKGMLSNGPGTINWASLIMSCIFYLTIAPYLVAGPIALGLGLTIAGVMAQVEFALGVAAVYLGLVANSIVRLLTNDQIVKPFLHKIHDKLFTPKPVVPAANPANPAPVPAPGAVPAATHARMARRMPIATLAADAAEKRAAEAKEAATFLPPVIDAANDAVVSSDDDEVPTIFESARDASAMQRKMK